MPGGQAPPLSSVTRHPQHFLVAEKSLIQARKHYRIVIVPTDLRHETVYNPRNTDSNRTTEEETKILSAELNDLIDLQLNKLKTRKDDIYGPQSVSYTT